MASSSVGGGSGITSSPVIEFSAAAKTARAVNQNIAEAAPIKKSRFLRRTRKATPAAVAVSRMERKSRQLLRQRARRLNVIQEEIRRRDSVDDRYRNYSRETVKL